MSEEKEEYRNIFDAASKIEHRKAMKEGADVAQGEEAVAKTTTPQTQEELAKKLEECKKMHSYLTEKLERAFVKSNISPTVLREYFDSPKNFNDEEWRKIQQKKREIDKMIAKLSPDKGKETKEPKEKPKHKKPKKMQVKSRWISMH